MACIQRQRVAAAPAYRRVHFDVAGIAGQADVRCVQGIRQRAGRRLPVMAADSLTLSASPRISSVPVLPLLARVSTWAPASTAHVSASDRYRTAVSVGARALADIRPPACTVPEPPSSTILP